MNWTFIEILTALYSVVWVVSIIAYLPTIDDLLHGIPSANLTTYSLWFFYYLVSVVYGVFVVHDIPFVFVSSLDALILLFISILILRLRYVNRRRQAKRAK